MAAHNSRSRRAAPSPVVLGCLAVGTLPFLGGALWAGVAAARALLEGNRDQTLGLGMVTFMLLVFAGIPALIVWAMSASRGASQDSALRRSNFPDAPWMWREDWARGEVVHVESTAGMVAMGLFAGVWNVFVLIMVVAAALRADPGERIVIFGALGLFVLAGLFLISVVVKMVLKRLRYGRSVFVLDVLPATPGSQLSGVVQAPAGLAAAPAFEVALYQVEAYRGENATETVEWQDAFTLPVASVDRGPSGLSIPVAFEIPQDAEPSSPKEHDRRRRLWRLTVKAAVSGVDYDADFEVPVFRTDAPQRLSRRSISARPQPAAPGEMAQPVTSRIRVEPTEGGTALQFPRPSWLIGWTLVPLVFPPAAAFLGRMPFLSDVPYPLVLAGGVGAMLCFWGMNFLGLVMTPSRIEVLSDRVLVRRGLGRFGWDRTVPLADVKSAVARTLGGQGQTQNSVDILTTSGGEYWAAIGLRDASEAKWLAAEIEQLVRAAQGA